MAESGDVRARKFLAQAVSEMWAAEAELDVGNPKGALAPERAAVKALDDAFGHERLALRALRPPDKPVDEAKRLSGPQVGPPPQALDGTGLKPSRDTATGWRCWPEASSWPPNGRHAPGGAGAGGRAVGAADGQRAFRWRRWPRLSTPGRTGRRCRAAAGDAAVSLGPLVVAFAGSHSPGLLGGGGAVGPAAASAASPVAAPGEGLEDEERRQ